MTAERAGSDRPAGFSFLRHGKRFGEAGIGDRFDRDVVFFPAVVKIHGRRFADKCEAVLVHGDEAPRAQRDVDALRRRLIRPAAKFLIISIHKIS